MYKYTFTEKSTDVVTYEVVASRADAAVEMVKRGKAGNGHHNVSTDGFVLERVEELKSEYRVDVAVSVIGTNRDEVVEHIQHCMCDPYDCVIGHNDIEIVSAIIFTVERIGDV